MAVLRVLASEPCVAEIFTTGDGGIRAAWFTRSAFPSAASKYEGGRIGRRLCCALRQAAHAHALSLRRSEGNGARRGRQRQHVRRGRGGLRCGLEVEGGAADGTGLGVPQGRAQGPVAASAASTSSGRGGCGCSERVLGGECVGEEGRRAACACSRQRSCSGGGCHLGPTLAASRRALVTSSGGSGSRLGGRFLLLLFAPADEPHGQQASSEQGKEGACRREATDQRWAATTAAAAAASRPSPSHSAAAAAAGWTTGPIHTINYLGAAHPAAVNELQRIHACGQGRGVRTARGERGR